MRGSCHKLGPRAELCGRGGFYSLFFGERETFFGGMGLHTQANTRPAARPPSGQSDIPRKGNLGGGTTWPASPFYFLLLFAALGLQLSSGSRVLLRFEAFR